MKIALYSDDSLDTGRGICRFTKKLVDTVQALYPNVEFYIVNSLKASYFFNVPYLPYNQASLLGNGIDFLLFYNNGKSIADYSFIQDLRNVSNLQTVSIVHDIIDVVLNDNNVEIALELTNKNIENKNYYQTRINLSDIIFTVSEHSKNDILKYLDVPKNKPIEVIYPASLLNTEEELKKDSYIGKSYFLYNGGYCSRKGIIQLLYNFIDLKLKNKIKATLVLTGEDRLNNYYINSLINYGIKEGYFINKGFVTDEELSILYHNALAMIYPSSYEGFGLPLLEAMKAGCPIITCYNTSIKEVCSKDSAYYINKFDSDSFQEALILFESEDFIPEKEKLIQNAYKNVKRFSWEKTAYKFINILKENKKSYIDKLKSLKLVLKETNKVINRLQKFKTILDDKYDLKLIDVKHANHKKISIVIVTYNRGSVLEEILRSLYNLNYPDFEVIVVVGPCTDNTTEVLKKYERDIKIVKCPVINISVARNIGIAMSCGDYVAFIDDDAIPHPNWLDKIILGFKTSEVAGVGSDVYYEDGITFQHRQCFNNRFDYNNFPVFFSYPYTFCFNSVVGVNCIFKKECLLDVKGFDEQYEYHLDEIDLCSRLVDYGYTIDYIEGAFVYHKLFVSHIRNNQKKITNWYVYGKNSAYFIKRYENVAGKDLITQAIHKINIVYKDKIMNIYKNNDCSKEEFLNYIKDLKEGIDQGLKDAERGPLLMTEETLKKYKSEYKKFNIG